MFEPCCRRGLAARSWRRKPRSHCEPVKYQPLGNTRPIAERPPASPNASNRAIRKSDLIIGARNRSAVVTLTKRTTRHALPAALPDGYQKHQPLIPIGAPGAGLTLSKLPQRLHMEQPPHDPYNALTSSH